MELGREFFILKDLLLVHLAQEFAHLLSDVEYILNGFQYFGIVDEALLNDLLQVLVMHLAYLFEVS